MLRKNISPMSTYSHPDRLTVSFPGSRGLSTRIYNQGFLELHFVTLLRALFLQ
jgi:hypothetical protein